SRAAADGIPALDRAIDRFERTGFGLRLASLLLSRGLLRERSGDRAAAERDWSSAIDRLESERRTVSVEQLRLSQAGLLRAIGSTVAASRIRAGADPDASLDAVEQSHAHTLVEHVLRRDSRSLTVADLRKRLPTRAAILYFLVREPTPTGWLLTASSTV